MQGAFNVNRKEKCNKWVFDEMERTIVNDVSLRSFIIYFFFISTYNLLAGPLLTVTVILYIHIVWYYVRGKQMETQHGGNRQ